MLCSLSAFRSDSACHSGDLFACINVCASVNDESSALKDVVDKLNSDNKKKADSQPLAAVAVDVVSDAAVCWRQNNVVKRIIQFTIVVVVA